MKVSLYYCEGTSDKVYHIQLESEGCGHVVNFQYGRRGSTLNCGTKTPNPVSLEEAEKIYNKLLKEKLGKGYQECETSLQTEKVIKAKNENSPRRLPQLLNPIDDPLKYIGDDEWMAQEKFDGERRMLSLGDDIGQFNKKGLSIPTIKKVSCDKKCDIDSECVGDHYFVFDITSLEETDLRDVECEKRYKILKKQKFSDNCSIVETAFTKKEKKALFERLQKENKEGIVFKRKTSKYTPGRPNSGGDQVKFKFYKTATFIVSNVTKGKRSVGIYVLDNGTKVPMGKVTIPPNKEIPEVGSFIEVRYLYAYKGGAAFQTSYLGKRNDQDETDATISQIVYKFGEEDDE